MELMIAHLFYDGPPYVIDLDWHLRQEARDLINIAGCTPSWLRPEVIRFVGRVSGQICPGAALDEASYRVERVKSDEGGMVMATGAFLNPARGKPRSWLVGWSAAPDSERINRASGTVSPPPRSAPHVGQPE